MHDEYLLITLRMRNMFWVWQNKPELWKVYFQRLVATK